MSDNSKPSPQAHRPAMPKPDVARGQFLRVEKFAAQAPNGKQGGNTIRKVAEEAVRTEGFCPHVAQPVPPTLLFGVGPLEAADLAESWSRHQTAEFFHKPSQTVMTRKFRADKSCALVGVISVPPEWTPGPRWAQFCEKSLDWLRERYREDRLKSVLEHRDERCLHLHFWVVPLADEAFSSIHPGEKALDEVGRRTARVIRDAAFKKAMAGLLDEFHQAVGRHFGLERQTVGGKRRTRSDWLRNRYLEEQRELGIQRRIDAAVAAAIHQLILDQSSAQALEKVITADIDIDSARTCATHCSALLSPASTGRAEPPHTPALSRVGAGLVISACALLHSQDETPGEAPPVAVSNASTVEADLYTQPSAAGWIRARNR